MSEHRRKPPQPQEGGRAAARRGQSGPSSGLRAAPPGRPEPRRLSSRSARVEAPVLPLRRRRPTLVWTSAAAAVALILTIITGVLWMPGPPASALTPVPLVYTALPSGTRAAEVAAAGPGIAFHGHRHRNLLRVTPRPLDDDLDRAYTAIADATDTAPVLHRPPYGIYSWPALRAVRQRGWTPLLWSRWGKDWRKFTTPERIAARAARDLGPGDVILLHDADHYSSKDSWRRTLAALPEILAAIQPTGSGSAGASAISQP